MSLWKSRALGVAALAATLFSPSRSARAADPTLRVDLGAGVYMDLALVKAGTFRQGSPATEAGRGDDESARDVTISRDFYVGKYPVTRGQFARFVAETRYRTEAEKGASGGSGFDGQGLVQRKEFNWKNPGFDQDDDHPVVLVTYDDALAFTQWLSGKAGRAAGLPTEAQWEMACRAGSTGRFYRGASDDEARTIAWFKANAGNGTRAVGQKKPNALGLFDMSGNVYEWVLDWYAPSYGSGPVREPLERRSTLSDKPRRVLRGGSWLKDARHVRCAARYRNTPGSRNADNGFRVAVSTEERGLAAAATPAPTARQSAVTEEPSTPSLVFRFFRTNLLAIPIVIAAFYVMVVLAKVLRGLLREWLGGGASGVRTHIGDDGFWIYSPDKTRGRPISYRATVDGSDQEGAIASPGAQGEYIYTGGRVTAVKVLGMAAAAGAAGALGQSLVSDDEDQRRRQRQDEDDRRRRDTFTGYPSAY